MRRSLFALPALLLLLTGSLFLIPSACNRTVKNDAYYEAVSRYIYAYTSGAIGRTDPIRVRFVNAAVALQQVGQKVDPAVWSISPSIPGEAVWEDDRTILLKPAQPLPHGATYKATVRVGKIYPAAAAQTFDFEFYVRELAFEVVTLGMRAENPNDLHVQQITGVVYTSEPVDAAALEKVIAARQGNKNLATAWTHSADGRRHDFSINGVERSNARSNVEIAWDGASVGVKKSGTIDQMIPSLDEFTVVGARVEQTDDQYVVLNFSDPVSTTQDLNGLIRISDFDGALRFAVDGNFVRVYPSTRVSGEHAVRVEAGVRNTANAAMQTFSSWTLLFEDFKPAVRLVGRGAIIPQQSSGSVIFPFEAVGLTAVDVEVFKIYNSNILQFLQVNEIEGEYELFRVGKIILQKKITLRELNPEANLRAWQRYALDLQEMIKQDPGAIYQVRLAFRRSYTDLPCNVTTRRAEDNGALVVTGTADDNEEFAHLNEPDEYGQLRSIFGGYRGLYYDDTRGWWEDEDYDWDRREEPCAKEYYHAEHFAQRNVFVSDLGLTGKRGKDGSLFACVTDLHSAQPLAGVNLEYYNYQLQPIGKAVTGADGTVFTDNMRETPFLAVATLGNRRGYLRMHEGSTLSLSRFDVAGVEAQKGLKGYIYGERGVWRPGDSIYLDFVLEDQVGNLPAKHPVSLELTDPNGALQARVVSNEGVGGVFALHTATRPDAPTGNWTAKVKVGGATFTRTLKIETVKPNRLKMELDFGKKDLSSADGGLKGKLSARWLHGATAKNLKARVELQVRSAKTEFKNYKDFVFDDPARRIYSDPSVLFDAELNDQGEAQVPLDINLDQAAPGKLIANFRVRVFERGGDFSTDNFALDYYPYERFLGVFIPTGRWGAKIIDKGQGGQVQFVMVDKNGNPLANKKIKVGLYRTDWRWWWDEDAFSNVAQFNSADHINAVDFAELTTDSRGLATWKVRPAGWGRYFVRATDDESGHAAGDFFWSGYPDNMNDLRSRNAAAMLPFTAEKEKYEVGQNVTLKVPAGESGRILLTLETGSRVAKHLWFDAKAGDNFIQFTATEDMAPAVYAHVSLIQPHAQTKNDLPIRMYGVIPVLVENPQTHLQPRISMPDVLKPDEEFSVTVSEGSGRACAYTLAIVDEGLLDLTRFQTPNPWEAFFAREALGVKSWDVFDYVLGAYGAELERVLSIGGDAINQKAKNAAQVNRFKPVVRHVGPFYLEKGKSAKHTFKITDYVGSVRVMAVCSAPAPGRKGAYGSAEKTCPVRKPLMVLPTLPRVLSPGETLRLPVDVFAMERSVKSATVRVRETSGLVTVQDGANTLNFSEPGNQMTYFDLKVGNKTGAARFLITAEGSGETARAEIELLVRNPNPVITAVTDGVVEPGKEWTGNFDAAQYTDIESAALEVSALPPINFTRHLQYLLQYPHGCVEQTVSTAFPQLYAEALAPLSAKQRKTMTENVTAAIGKLRRFQGYTGGFSYWPGSEDINDWSSTYAGHFLLEARNQGYAVPAGMIDNWINYQQRMSRQWNGTAVTEPWMAFDNDLGQAYRLYTLALAGKPDMAGMNRLQERKELYLQAAALLSAAYAQAGKAEAARNILSKSWKNDWSYSWCGYTYGSNVRDRSLLLEVYTLTGDMQRAEGLVKDICAELGNSAGWWSTQSLATSLRALSKYAAKATGTSNAAFSYKIGSGAYRAGGEFKLVQVLDFTESASTAGILAVKNNGGAKLYTRLVVNGRPKVGSATAQSENLQLAVRYTDLAGKPIDVNRLPQGSDFVAEVTVKRVGNLKFDFNELALEQVFPAGWEILNSRMTGIEQLGNSPMDYLDVRDDRVYIYFDIPYSKPDRRSTPLNVESRTYRVQLNAAYTGRYYLPTVNCEAMYDNRIRAAEPGRWVEVI